MISPPLLQPGDAVGIVAPAGFLAEADVTASLNIIRSWGLEVVLGKYLYNRRNSFAGTDNQRAADLQQMLDDKNIRAILCARGGYGTIRIMEKLRFDKFQKNPKWIVGYSDITVLHSCLQQCLGIESIHGTMLRFAFPKVPDMVSFDSLHSLLFGNIKEYALQAEPSNRTGEARGILTGGNLSVLYSLAGSRYEPDTDGKILFLEDISEYLYHIDRMVMNLRIRDRFRHLNGLIIGHMTDMKSSPSGYRKPAHEIILEAVREFSYPVMFGFPAGHEHPNLSLIMGREIHLTVDPDFCKLTF
jgi:muramoyltetrapeptide carboxypeptidase